MGLNRVLPSRFVAEPQVHLGSSVEVDVATYEEDAPSRFGEPERDEGTPSTAVWAPPLPTLAVATGPPNVDEYEVRVYDTSSGRRLVAAIEIVSPSNKDRPEHRRAFVSKCAALLQNQVCVSIVDLVTTRTANLYADLINQLGHVDPTLGEHFEPLYAASCRWVRNGGAWLLETWLNPLILGQPLPILPLWVEDHLAVPLDLEASYEETRRVLRLD